MLRAGSKEGGIEVDLSAVVTTGGTDETVDAGVTHGAEIIAFVDALNKRDEINLPETRQKLRAVLGDEGFVDVAGVASCFEAFNRIADATGIPIDPHMEQYTAKLREKLNLNAFSAANRSKE